MSEMLAHSTAQSLRSRPRGPSTGGICWWRQLTAAGGGLVAALLMFLFFGVGIAHAQGTTTTISPSPLTDIQIGDSITFTTITSSTAGSRVTSGTITYSGLPVIGTKVVGVQQSGAQSGTTTSGAIQFPSKCVACVITATFSNNNSGDASVVTTTVNALVTPTMVTLQSNSNPVTFGTLASQWNATVRDKYTNNPIRNITVTLSISGTVVQTKTTNASGVAVFNVDVLSPAFTAGATTYPMTVTVASDPSTGAGASSSTPIAQVVNKISTTTYFVNSPISLTYGLSDTVDIWVDQSVVPNLYPTSTVVLYLDSLQGTIVNTGTLYPSYIGRTSEVTYTVSFSNTWWKPGTHTLYAVFQDYNQADGAFATSYATQTVIINKLMPTGWITPNNGPPILYGDLITFTAAVTGTGFVTPTGQVTFSQAKIQSANFVLNPNPALTATTALTTQLVVGTNVITAYYGGDDYYLSAVFTATQVVSKENPSLGLTWSPITPTFGNQNVAFTAQVSVTNKPFIQPTGTVSVTFNASPTVGITGTLAPGPIPGTSVVTVYTNTVGAVLQGGSHALELYYLGDGNLVSGAITETAQMTITVNPADSNITLNTNTTPITTGTYLTFTGQVNSSTSALGSAGVPSGTVTLWVLNNSTWTSVISAPVTNTTYTIPNVLLDVGVNGITTTFTSSLGPCFGSCTGGPNHVDSTSSQVSVNVLRLVTMTADVTGTMVSVGPSSFYYGFPVTVTAYLTGSGVPVTGMVLFYDENNTYLGMAQVENTAYQAKLPDLILPSGVHTITAVYPQTDVYVGAVATTVYYVDKLSSFSTLNVTPNTTKYYGQDVTFAAFVGQAMLVLTGYGDKLTPRGTVTMYVANAGGVFITTTGTLNNNSSYNWITYTIPAGGPYTATLAYEGDQNFEPSTFPENINSGNSLNPPQVFTVSKGIPNLAVLMDPGTPVYYGTPIVARVSLTGGFGTPTGSVVLYVDGISTTIALTTTTVNVPLDLGLGNHIITATYSGDSNYIGVASAAPDAHQVVFPGTQTTLVGAPDPSSYGKMVTLTATVIATSTTVVPPSLVPTGTLVLLVDGTPVSSTQLAGGVATFQAPLLDAGTHTAKAVYDGVSGVFGPSSQEITLTVAQASTGVVLASSLNPSTYGDAVLFTATVTGAIGTPGGVVIFDLGGVTATVNLVNGVAVLATSNLPVGVSAVTAAYQGTVNYQASTSNTVAQTVTQASTAVALASSSGSTTYGQQAAFTATVTSNATAGSARSRSSIAADGQVTFNFNGLPVTADLVNGVATVAKSDLPAGTNVVTATYSGNVNFAGSTSTVLSQNVAKASTLIVLTSAPNPTFAGIKITFSAEVVGGITVPDGTVTFTINGVAYQAALSNGVAKVEKADLPAGNYQVTASYGGNNNYLSSAANTIVQVVLAAPSAYYYMPYLPFAHEVK